jgi:uncharacterized protein YacL
MKKWSVIFAMTIILLLTFAYYWLGNTVHEIAGTFFFVLVIVHNCQMIRWYKRKHDFINKIVTYLLIFSNSVLLLTSLLISNLLYKFTGFNTGFTLRQIHIVTAYWTLIMVALHLGLRWPTIIKLIRSKFQFQQSKKQTIILRLLSIGIIIQGICSFKTLGMDGKLFMRMSLDWWNFEESVIGYFYHLFAIVGLFASLIFYLNMLVTRIKEAKKKGG